jgi:hypothetical protein
LFALINCSPRPSDYIEVNTKNSNKDLTYKLSQFQLDADSIAFNVFDVYHDGTNEHLIIMNSLSKMMEIYNLTKNKLVFRKPYHYLANEGIKSIEFYNYDSIFILQENFIFLVDTTRIKLSININTDKGQYKTIVLSNLDHAPIYFDGKKNTLSIQSYCYACPTYSKSFYTSPIHVSLSIDTENFIDLPIRYPTIYLNSYYGFHNIIHRMEYADRYMISFSADPNLYIYNKLSNKVIIKGAKSKYQTNTINPLNKRYKSDANMKLKHITLEPLYREVFYDVFRNLYYRFYMTGIKEKNNDGTFNLWEDKDLILMVFDSDIHLITEINLGKGIYNSAKSFVGEQGLYLYKNKYEDTTLLKNNLYYDVFKID